MPQNVHKGREVGENGQWQTLVPKGDRATDFDDVQSENAQTRRTNRKITIFPLAVKASSRQCCLVPASWGEEAETNGGRQGRPNGAWSWGHPRKTHHTKDATHELGLGTFFRRSWEDPPAWRCDRHRPKSNQAQTQSDSHKQATGTKGRKLWRSNFEQSICSHPAAAQHDTTAQAPPSQRVERQTSDVQIVSSSRQVRFLGPRPCSVS